MPITARQLGSELIRRSAARGKPISNLSLQKLAYFAHGWYLAIVNKPLVEEQFEAWAYGPVLPNLYHTFKGFSSNPIPADHPLVTSQDQLAEDSLDAKLIDRVLEVYGEYGSFDLVDLSHDQEGPWYPAYHDPAVPSTIDNQAIRDYFANMGG